MAHAYTPGLKVLQEAKVVKERRLPLKGNVVVKAGQTVAPEDIVATTDLPGNVRMVNVANLLNIDAPDIRDVMLLKEGDVIQKDGLLAETKGIFGMFKSQANSLVDGTIEAISDRSEEHTSELQSQAISYAVFCLKKKKEHTSELQ